MENVIAKKGKNYYIKIKVISIITNFDQAKPLKIEICISIKRAKVSGT